MNNSIENKRFRCFVLGHDWGEVVFDFDHKLPQLSGKIECKRCDSNLTMKTIALSNAENAKHILAERLRATLQSHKYTKVIKGTVHLW